MKKGFTLVEIIIVVAIIGLLAAIVIPSLKADATSQDDWKKACINNLRQLEAAKDQYAIETGRTNGWSFADDTTAFSNLVVGAITGPYIKHYPSCPASSSTQAVDTIVRSVADYHVNAIGTAPSCTVVSVGIDAHVL
jgi:prepilin-type N-terminal cleavage/methylation domain-containing protein